MKRFKLFFHCTAVVFAVGLISSCSGAGGDVSRLVEERDSLRDVSRQQYERLGRLDSLIVTINTSLDTIAVGEAGIFVDGVQEGAPDTKQQILGNIDRLASLIAKQKSQIEELESRLGNADGQGNSDANAKALIANFKKQLEQKDRQIAALKEELSQKNADISRLNQRIGLQSQTIAELDRRNAAQIKALKRQDAMLNHCYMTIGTKNDLQAKGIVKKGKILPQASLDPSKFSKVDIRRFTEIQFTAKRPRIITPMPESSYEIIKGGKNEYTLRITNPTAFWKVSNFLVIQTN